MHPYYSLPVMEDQRWWMQAGERFAIEGLLTQLRPRLAVEIGTFQGGSLRRIALHAEHVHAFDLDPAVSELAPDFPNVTFHIGDSAETLPAALSELEREGRHVDFALVDGAHTREAVRSDGSALLESGACRQTVIVFHDSAHAGVRAGLDDLSLADHPKVAAVMLDLVPGLVVAEHEDETLLGQSFNGLGLVVLDADRDPTARAYDAPEFVRTPDLHRAHRAAARPQRTPRSRVALAAAAGAVVGAAGAALALRER
jgi:Methyltransferase domain